MLFLSVIGLNWGRFLFCCWSPATKRHIRPLSPLSRFTLFCLTVACWLDEGDSPTSSGLLRATTSLQKGPYDWQLLRRKWCQEQRTEFFNILHFSVHGLYSFVFKPSPNVISYPVKNSSTLKISGFCCFCRRKYQPTKLRSLQKWRVLSCELNNM